MTRHTGEARPEQGTNLPPPRVFRRGPLAGGVLALLSCALAQISPRLALSGTTGDLSWAVYQAETRAAARAASRADLVLATYPVGKLLGIKYDDDLAEIRWASRIPKGQVNVRWFYNHYYEQMTAQGFALAGDAIDAGFARAIYQKGNDRVELLMYQDEPNTYRVRVNLLGARETARGKGFR